MRSNVYTDAADEEVGMTLLLLMLVTWMVSLRLLVLRMMTTDDVKMLMLEAG